MTMFTIYQTFDSNNNSFFFFFSVSVSLFAFNTKTLDSNNEQPRP